MSNAATYYALSSILDECKNQSEEHYRQAILELMYHLEDESNRDLDFYKILEEKNKIHNYQQLKIGDS